MSHEREKENVEVGKQRFEIEKQKLEVDEQVAIERLRHETEQARSEVVSCLEMFCKRGCSTL